MIYFGYSYANYLQILRTYGEAPLDFGVHLGWISLRTLEVCDDANRLVGSFQDLESAKAFAVMRFS